MGTFFRYINDICVVKPTEADYCRIRYSLLILLLFLGLSMSIIAFEFGSCTSMLSFFAMITDHMLCFSNPLDLWLMTAFAGFVILGLFFFIFPPPSHANYKIKKQNTHLEKWPKYWRQYIKNTFRANWQFQVPKNSISTSFCCFLANDYAIGAG